VGDEEKFPRTKEKTKRRAKRGEGEKNARLLTREKSTDLRETTNKSAETESPKPVLLGVKYF
jgi:hypothetical protein